MHSIPSSPSFFTWWGDKTQSELLHLVGRQNAKWASSPGGATKRKVSFFTWWGDKTQSELLHLVGRQNAQSELLHLVGRQNAKWASSPGGATKKWASSPGGATKHKVSFFTWWGDKTQSELLQQNTKWASSPGGATKHKVSFFTWWGDAKWASSPGGATKRKVYFLQTRRGNCFFGPDNHDSYIWVNFTNTHTHTQLNMHSYKYLKKFKAGVSSATLHLTLCRCAGVSVCVCACGWVGICTCRWVCKHACVHENQVKNLCVHIFVVPFLGLWHLFGSDPSQQYTDLLLNTEQAALPLALMNSHCCGVLTCSLGNLCSLSSSAAMGTSSLSAKSRQVLRSISCVSGKLARLLNTRMRDCSCTAPLHPEIDLLH